MSIRQAWFALLLVLGAVAPAAAAEPRQAPAGRLVLEEFFRGTLLAEGTFTNTRDGTVRGIKVRMRGTWDGRTLTLVEDFVYSDGERDRKTWRFTRVAEGRYTGTREDVLGDAEVFQDGDAVRLRYSARVTTKDGSAYTIRFDDLLVKTGPRTVRNTADLSFLRFIPVGKVDLLIRRVSAR